MMAKIDPLVLAGSKAKGERPWFLESPDTERLLNISLALIQEVAVMRERMDTMERLLERDGALSKASIEAFSPTKEEAADRGLWTQEYLARIFRMNSLPVSNWRGVKPSNAATRCRQKRSPMNSRAIEVELI